MTDPEPARYQLRLWTDRQGVTWHVWLFDTDGRRLADGDLRPQLSFVSHEWPVRTRTLEVSEGFLLEEATDADLAELLVMNAAAASFSPLG